MERLCTHCQRPLPEGSNHCPVCLGWSTEDGSAPPQQPEWYKIAASPPGPVPFAISVIALIAVCWGLSLHNEDEALAWLALPAPLLWLGRGDLRNMIPILVLGSVCTALYFVFALIVGVWTLTIGVAMTADLGSSLLGTLLVLIIILCAGVYLPARLTHVDEDGKLMLALDWIGWGFLHIILIVLVFDFRGS